MPVMHPNVFIIGAPKCGTSSLAHYLGHHPQAFFSTPKEPGYWARDFPWLALRHRLHSLDDYLRLFRKAQPQHRGCIGEASTMYLSSGEAVDNILRFNPDARFIVMLRDPVEVAQAFHMQKLLQFQEDQPDFETAWRLQQRRRSGECIPLKCLSPILLQYQQIASLGEQVRRLLQRASREAICFLRYEEFKRDPGASYRDVLRFLQLRDDGRSKFPVIGAARTHRFPELVHLLRQPPALVREPIWRLRRFLLGQRHPWVEKLRRSVYRQRTRLPISFELREEMTALFAPQVIELEALLGWDLSTWKLPTTVDAT